MSSRCAPIMVGAQQENAARKHIPVLANLACYARSRIWQSLITYSSPNTDHDRGPKACCDHTFVRRSVSHLWHGHVSMRRTGSP